MQWLHGNIFIGEAGIGGNGQQPHYLVRCLVICAVDGKVEEASQQLVHFGAWHISHMISACVCEVRAD